MKNTMGRLFALLTISLFLLSGCGSESPDPVPTSISTDESTILTEVPKTQAPIDSSLQNPGPASDYTEDRGQPYPQTQGTPIAPEPVQIPVASDSFSLSDIPPFSGDAYIAVNDNCPYFTDSDVTINSFETYSPLDSLGRCGVAYACVGQDIMPTGERGSIGQVKPTGWHTVKYDCVDGKYLYNRCHLIGFQLTGENANEENLITGTRYLNTEGMLPFENMVADYVTETGNHVLYRVTPIYEGKNLLAAGVLLEGYSVEDQGDDVAFCVFAYNAQPGIRINYTNGESELESVDTTTQQNSPQKTPDATVAPGEIAENTSGTEPQQDWPKIQQDYVLNINTKKFHLPTCSSADEIKVSNRQDCTGSRDELIEKGYDPCKRCNP